MKKIRKIALVGVVLSALFSCEKDEPNILNTNANTDLDTNEVASKKAFFAGAVYAMNNSETNNLIYSYGRKKNGSLTLIDSINTGGLGTGPVNILAGSGADVVDPLSSNYSLILSPDNKFLFAVNAGSNEVSSFIVKKDFKLKRISKVSSGGVGPVSIAVNQNSVYVVNVNSGISTIIGYTYDNKGRLQRIPNSKRRLTGRSTALKFSPNGKFLISTELDTQRLQVFQTKANNSLSAKPVTFEYKTPQGRNVANPFGIYTFSSQGSQFLTVSEARIFNIDGALAPQTSSISTFKIKPNGRLATISLDVRVDNDNDDSQGGLASCWVVQNKLNQAFSINTVTSDISTLKINGKGQARLINPQAFVEEGFFLESGLTDVVAIKQYVYQLFSGAGSIVSLKTSLDGSLEEIDRDTDLNLAGGNQGITGF